MIAILLEWLNINIDDVVSDEKTEIEKITSKTFQRQLQ